MKLNIGAGQTPLDMYSVGSLPRIPGVYCIRNTAAGKVYVGSSNNLWLRALKHRSELRRGKHCNHYLQRAWDKWGEQSFQWETLSLNPVESLIQVEQSFIESLNAAARRNGYNLIKDAIRHEFTAEVIEQMRRVRSGKKPWNVGVPCPEHVKLAGIRANTGRIKTDSERAKLSLAMLGPSHPHRGKSIPAEWKEKMSRAQHSIPAKAGTFKGVHLDKRTRTFMARIYANGHRAFLGRYKSEEDAARAYNIAAKRYFGEDCFLNPVAMFFPKRRTVLGQPRKERGSYACPA